MQDSIAFIKLVNDELKFDNRLLCTAIHIFIMFTRKHPFTTFNMHLACTMSHMIAAKIEYKHPRIEFYSKFAHERAPYPKPMKGKKTAERKPFEEVKNTILEEAMTVELDILTCLQFDFEFAFPFTYVKQYLQLCDQSHEIFDLTLKRCLDIVYLKTPQRAYYLFYHPALLAAGILATTPNFDLIRYQESVYSRVHEKDVEMISADFNLFIN